MSGSTTPGRGPGGRGQGERGPGERGRHAQRPWQIPARGWWEILKRSVRNVGRHNLEIVSAGVAFYAFLAIFPGLAALVSLYGLVADVSELKTHLEAWSQLLPEDAWRLIRSQVEILVTSSDAQMSLAFLVSLAITLWSASRGFKVMLVALNIVYGESDNRGFIRQNGLALGLAIGGIFLIILFFGATVMMPVIFQTVGLGGALEVVLNLLRWPASAILFLLALALLYRIGPRRRDARWQWVSVGALLALGLWLLATAGFSWYASSFATYNETYGSLAAVVVLLMWFYISVFVVLLGAVVNAETEHQTRVDTTVGPARPIGQRGAYVADNVAGTDPADGVPPPEK